MNKKALFLDRDGVINKKLADDYVKKVSEFEFLPDALDAIVRLREIYSYIFIVTNQQGIGKKIMTEQSLQEIHAFMRNEIEKKGGKIDKIYYCPNLSSDNASCRKPNIGMVEKAWEDFPEIKEWESVMVGDSSSDLEMGKRLGFRTVYIGSTTHPLADENYCSLGEFSKK